MAATISRYPVFITILLCAGATVAATVTDDSGTEIRLPTPASRIISLAPHLTELLFAAGAGDRVVGAVRYSDYPPAARRLPRVGDAHSIDIERVLALQPNLIVAWQSGNPAGQLEHLRQLRLPLYISEPRRLKDIATTIEELGTLARTVPAAEQAARRFRQRLAALRHRYSDREPVRVFYQIWHQPLITIGGNHIINEVIRLCGGRSVFGNIDQLAPRISIEAVMAAAPDIIIASGTGNERPEWLDEWRLWPQLPAVRHDRLHFIPAELLQRHTPRLLDGAKQMCEILELARKNSES